MARTQINASLIVTTGQSAIVPSGTVMDYAGPTAPSGWLECDGSAVSRTTYASLFAGIGTTWGVGDGSTTFNLPDFRRRASVGRGGTGTGTLGSTLGSVGGEENHILSVAELAAHNHGVTDPGHNHTQNAHTHTVTDPGHNHTQNSHSHGGVSLSSSSCCGGDGTASVKTVNNNTGSFGSGGTGGATATNNSSTTGITNANATATNNSNTTGITTNNNGSGTGHNTIQPSAVVIKIIKI